MTPYFIKLLTDTALISSQQIAFRVYTEALWYPGRQFNLITAKQLIPRKSGTDLSLSSSLGSSGGSAVGGTGTPIKVAG